MNLRPHHLLCIQKFTGKGYDEDFTEHMKAVVSELKNNSMAQITVVQGCDELCGMCPNNKRGVCTSCEKTALMDDAVVKICDLGYGENVLWTTASKKARELIFGGEEFHNICSSCMWFELCRKTEVNYD